ncbi:MAG: PAS domain-containing protein [Blautia sp.]|nr:PAS domain-containing protein [Blautia sp.]
MLDIMFRSVLEQDRASIVLCDLNHTIVYMNPAAQKNYVRYGGNNLIGKSLLDCHNSHSVEMIKKVLDWFAESTDNNMIYTSRNEKQNKDIYMVALRDEAYKLIGYYEKQEFRTVESAGFYDFSKSLTGAE